MEQLELSPNQDYEDALAWLTDGLYKLGVNPMVLVNIQREFESCRSCEMTREHYFEIATEILSFWG